MNCFCFGFANKVESVAIFGTTMFDFLLSIQMHFTESIHKN